MDSIKVIKGKDDTWCCVYDCHKDCCIDIKIITSACTGHNRFCLTHFRELRSKIDALNVLVQTGLDTREDV